VASRPAEHGVGVLGAVGWRSGTTCGVGRNVEGISQLLDGLLDEVEADLGLRRIEPTRLRGARLSQG
jgi:hypothetical protein